MKRLCFLSPDVDHAQRVVADLKAEGIPERHIYVVAKEGIALKNLPDAGPEADDFLPAYERGLAMGGATGLVAGLFALAFPPTGLVIGGGAVLLISLFGAGVGGFLTGIAGAAFDSSRLQQFEEAIDNGQLLVMADVPKDEIDHYEALIRSADPEVEVVGVEPPAPIVP